MSTAITLPNGIKFRSASRRRYVLVRTWRGKAEILKRSDSVATITAEFDRKMDSCESGDSSTRTRNYVVDTTTGETIKAKDEDNFRWV